MTEQNIPLPGMGLETAENPTGPGIKKIESLTPRTRITHHFKRPKDEEGITWKAVYEDPYRPHKRTGWMAVVKFDEEHPPDNFTPADKVQTTDEDHPPIISRVQAVSQALDRKQEEGEQ